MKTANMTPKNLVPMLLIGAGLLWWLTRRTANAAGVIVPSATGASVAQQAADAARNQALINLSGGLAGWLSGLKPSVVTSDARDAVRAGDPYYSSGPEIGPGAEATAAAWSSGAGLGMDTLSNMGLTEPGYSYNAY